MESPSNDVVPTKEVPLDLIEQTLSILLQLPVAQGYLLVKRWEEVYPDFFKPSKQ